MANPADYPAALNRIAELELENDGLREEVSHQQATIRQLDKSRDQMMERRVEERRQVLDRARVISAHFGSRLHNPGDMIAHLIRELEVGRELEPGEPDAKVWAEEVSRQVKGIKSLLEDATPDTEAS